MDKVTTTTTPENDPLSNQPQQSADNNVDQSETQNELNDEDEIIEIKDDEILDDQEDEDDDDAYVEGEGDETLEIDTAAGEYDEDNEELDLKGDTEEHDGDKYDADVVDQAEITWKLHKDSVFSITIDESERILVSGSGDDTATIVDMTTGSVLAHLNNHFDDSVIKVQFSPRYTIPGASQPSTFLAIASMSGLVQIYTLESLVALRTAKQAGEEIELDPEQEFNPEFDLDTFTWHPSVPLIGAACSNGQIWTYDLLTQESKPFYGHNDSVNSLIFNHNGSLLISASLDGQVIVNPMTKDRKQLKHKQLDKDSPPGIALAMHPNNDSNIICVGSGEGGVYTLSAVDAVHGGAKSPNAHTDSIEKVAFYQINPKTLYLFSSSIDGTLKAWNFTDSLQARYTISLPYAVTSFHFHPVAQLLFVASHDGILRVFNAVTGQHLKDLTGHFDAILDMIVYKDSVWTSSDDKSIKKFNLTTLLPAELLQPPQSITVQAQGAQPTNQAKPTIVGGNFARRPVVKPGKPQPQ